MITINKFIELTKMFESINKYFENGLTLEYHSLENKNCEGYPYFVQWNYLNPVFSIGGEIIPIPEEVAFGFEKALGNVKGYDDYHKKIEEAFKIKESTW